MTIADSIHEKIFGCVVSCKNEPSIVIMNEKTYKLLLKDVRGKLHIPDIAVMRKYNGLEIIRSNDLKDDEIRVY